MIFFDALTLSFIDSRITSVPSGAVQITSEQRAKAIDDASKPGFKLGSDENRMPVAVPAETESLGKLLDMVKTEMRIQRAPMLDAVTGIGWEASEAGDAALVAEARAIRLALLDITDDQALNAATTLDAMRAAGVLAYRRIAAGASAAFAATFKEHTGA